MIYQNCSVAVVYPLCVKISDYLLSESLLSCTDASTCNTFSDLVILIPALQAVIRISLPLCAQYLAILGFGIYAHCGDLICECLSPELHLLLRRC